MAHECPKCYAKCHCNGDIDDLIFECSHHCNHCPNNEDDDIDYDDTLIEHDEY